MLPITEKKNVNARRGKQDAFFPKNISKLDYLNDAVTLHFPFLVIV